MPQNNTNNKGTITEKDIATLLQRYTATTVLTLLQEVAQCPGDKFDWNELVRNTSTGITNAREYQMLWRHLAYRSSVSDDLEEGALPLDDDSDLEYELDADPSVSNEASAEAAACVKVMMASGLSSDSNMPNCSTIEAPLTINIPNGDSSGVPNGNSEPACSVQGMNITVPISVQKQPLPASTFSAGPANNNTISASLAARRKRKKWSTEEDLELIAAVQKCGEGNWANILRGDFTGDRTASQLSQRWSTLRRRKGETSMPGTSSAVPQLTEAQLAARHAMSVALGTPAKNLTSGSGSPSLMSTPNRAAQPSAVAEAPAHGRFAYGQHQSQQAPIIPKSSPVGPMGLAEKSQVSMKNLLPRSNLGSDSVIATAVAAGARIVTPSDAGTLLKAAQAKTPMHISSISGSSKKLPMTGGIPTQAHTPASAPHTNHPVATSSTSYTVKAALPKVQHTPSPSAALPKLQHTPSPSAALPKVQHTPSPSAVLPKLQHTPSPSAARPKLQHTPSPSAALLKIQHTPSPSAGLPKLQHSPSPSAALPKSQHAPSAALPKLHHAPSPSAVLPKLQQTPLPSAALPKLHHAPSSSDVLPKLQPTPLPAAALLKLQHTPSAALPKLHHAPSPSAVLPKLQHTPLPSVALQKLQHTPTPSACAVSSKNSAEQNSGANCGPSEIKTSKGTEVSKLNEVPKVVEEGRTLSTKDTMDKQVKEEKATLRAEAEFRIQVGNVEIASNALHAEDAHNDPKACKDNPAEDQHKNDLKMGDTAIKGGENQTVECQKQNTNEKHGGVQSMPEDACGRKLGVPNKVETSNGV